MKNFPVFSSAAWLLGAAIFASTVPSFAAPKTAAKTLSPLSPAFRLPPGRELEAGVVWNEVRLPGADAGVTRLWIYRPAGAQIGDGKYPVVFVAPAGTRLYYGSRVGPGSMPEHLPYARAGMIVVAYEIDGQVSESAAADSVDHPEVLRAAGLFRAAQGGVKNGRQALSWTLSHVPRVDANRLYAAGHSSAGTLALQFAQHEPRLAACAAYAPATDTEERIGPQGQAVLDANLPGYAAFIRSQSPWNNAARLKCPTLLFHADDDSNEPLANAYAFGQQVYRTNKSLRFCRVPTGNHYDAMIQSGIPTAVQWFGSLPVKGAKTKSKTKGAGENKPVRATIKAA